MKILSFVIIMCFLGCSSLYKTLHNRLESNYKEGITYYQKGNYKDAESCLKIVVSMDSEYKQAKYYLAKSLYYTRMKERNVKAKANQYYYKGQAHQRNGDYIQAIEAYRESDKYGHPTADKQISICKEQLLKRYDKDVKIAKELFKKKRYIPAYQKCLDIKTYKRFGDANTIMSKIEDIWENQTKKYKKDIEYYYHKKKNYEKANSLAERILKINPYDTNAKAILFYCKEMLGKEKRYKEARKYYSKRNYFIAYYKFKALDPFKDSSEYMDKSKENFIKSIPSIYQVGTSLYQKGKYKESVEYFNMILTFEPSHQKAVEYKERAEAKLKVQQSLHTSWR